MIYHIGFRPETRNSSRERPCQPLSGKLIIEASQCVDNLSCDLWEYLGKREITKKELRKNRFEIMRTVNRDYKTNFTKVGVN